MFFHHDIDLTTFTGSPVWDDGTTVARCKCSWSSRYEPTREIARSAAQEHMQGTTSNFHVT